MDFAEAFEKLIGHEGGYTLGKGDPGGETCYGISKRSYPHEDIKGMTLDRAKSIYKRDFWGPADCDLIPDAMRFQIFDMAVNSGVSRAIKTLQQAAAVEVDGILGPQTLVALHAIPAPRLVALFNGYRLTFMASLPAWTTFGRGWALRIAANLLEA